MLSSKKEVNPLALEILKEQILPHWDEMRDRKKLFILRFLEDPDKRLEESLRTVGNFHLQKMVFEYVKRKGWTWEDKKGRKHLIWQRDISAELKEEEDGNILLKSSGDLRRLEEIKKALEEIREKRAEKFLKVKATEWKEIKWWASKLSIYYKLASKVLGRDVKDREELSFEEAQKVIDWIVSHYLRS